MKTNKKLFTTFAVFVLMLLMSVFCVTAFAEKADDDAQTPSAEKKVVSGCDLKKEDLQMEKVKMTGFSILVPKGDVITVESDSSVFEKAKLSYGLVRSPLISENAFFYFNTNTDNYCQVYAGFEDLKPLDSYYGDYAKLTDEQKNELIAQNSSGDDGSTDVRFEKVNGRTYLLIAKSEEDTGTGNKYRVYAMYTVIGSYKYIVQIVAVNPDKNDLQVVNEMLNSIKLGGIKEPLSPLNIALIVCVVVLLAAVAFAYFTLYRLDRFVKTGETDIPMFGFNLPASSAEEDDADGDDDFEDDDDADGTAALDADEKIVDDESDSE